MKKRLFLMSSVLALASCIFMSCEEQQAPDLQVKYETKVLQPQSIVYNMSFPATTSGTTEIKVYPQVDGTIMAKNVTTGTKVEKGQTIFIIDPTELQLNVQAAEANLAVANARMETTKLQYESNQELYKKNIISEYVLKTSLNEFNSAKATVLQAEAQLNIARTNLGYCTITAPLTGYIDAKGFEKGDMATRTQYLCTISDNSTIDAEFSLTETQLLETVKEYGLRVTNKGLAGPQGKFIGDIVPHMKLKLKDGSYYNHDGIVTKIGAIVNTQTGTVPCTAEFPNPDGVLRSGMVATLIIPYNIDNMLCVPQTAAVRLQDQLMFYRVKADGTVEGVICEALPSNDGKDYYIIQGLNAGDEVVTNGVRKLSNGVKVR
ncbi:MAG: efflux RND transporter periplasmic adaptor subunit [Bacteroidales bacterium]|nr:efflux RND transporter periplasmic adaptor subunit [Bacteroidales bacterium]